MGFDCVSSRSSPFYLLHWLFWVYGSLGQYARLYLAVSQKEKKKKRIDRIGETNKKRTKTKEKIVIAAAASKAGSCPTISKSVGPPALRTTQLHRPTPIDFYGIIQFLQR